MLNFWRNNGQKTIIPYTNAWQLHRKHVRLRAPVWGVAGHAARGLRKQHHGKAEVRWNWQSVFCLWKTALNNYCLVSFLRNNHFWAQTNGAEFQISSFLTPVLRTWATCFSWFYSTKIKSSFQFKSQYNRITERLLTLPIIQPFQIKGQYNGQVRPARPVLIITPFQFKGQYNLNISKDIFVVMRHRPRLFASISLQFFSIHFPKMPCQFSWCYALIKLW